MDDALCSQQVPEAHFPNSLLMRPDWKAGAWCWHFRRNCSISPRQLLGVFLTFALFSASFALFCWSDGARFVTPFAALEVLALGWALMVYARHAADFERILISAEAVVIERVHGGLEERIEFHPRRVRIQTQGCGLVQVSEQDRQISIGRYLRPDRRQSLARDLRRAILLT